MREYGWQRRTDSYRNQTGVRNSWTYLKMMQYYMCLKKYWNTDRLRIWRLRQELGNEYIKNKTKHKQNRPYLERVASHMVDHLFLGGSLIRFQIIVSPVQKNKTGHIQREQPHSASTTYFEEIPLIRCQISFSPVLNAVEKVEGWEKNLLKQIWTGNQIRTSAETGN